MTSQPVPGWASSTGQQQPNLPYKTTQMRAPSLDASDGDHGHIARHVPQQTKASASSTAATGQRSRRSSSTLDGPGPSGGFASVGPSLVLGSSPPHSVAASRRCSGDTTTKPAHTAALLVGAECLACSKCMRRLRRMRECTHKTDLCVRVDCAHGQVTHACAHVHHAIPDTHACMRACVHSIRTTSRMVHTHACMSGRYACISRMARHVASRPACDTMSYLERPCL